MDGLSPELLLRHSRPGPRYTSYPTVPHWTHDVGDAEFAARLPRAGGPTSVYVHVPFCKEQCSFCGCNMVVAGRREPGTRSLDALARQVAALPLEAEQVPVQRIHLGGGTPTWHTPEELERLFAILATRFRPVPGAEISVEADPEVTTDEQVRTLAALGVNRLSMGVQSFDPEVLAGVNRPQRSHRVFEIMDLARSLGMHSLNLDLMYGLPRQTPDRFAATLATTLKMRPDRLAIFGYAHVPWLKAHQKKIDAAALPGPVDRVALFLLAHRLLTGAGYQAIGMDHFALVDDGLSRAQRAGDLHRNFMGYTTQPGGRLVGLGMSAISELPDLYVQQHSKLSTWWKAVEAGAPVQERGIVLTAEDQLRRDLINALMCNFRVDLAAFGQAHGLDFQEHFALELSELGPLIEDGLLEHKDGLLEVPLRGRLLVRNVAMVFDPWLRAPAAAGPRFSQTV